MFQKGAKLYGIFKNKCPQCHNGDFFIESNMFTFKNVLKIHERCSNCHLKYMIEPSFFYGAMYITYALTIAVAFVISLMGYLMGLSFIGVLIFISIILTILSPLSLRLSRLIYINIFVHFDKSKSVDN
ncbi:MAG: DUF983 domain-containing protein [Flavobacteriaceae bacterium]|nr:DUF983 domain-containing protein [Flavobacteriaceae bacterium]